MRRARISIKPNVRPGGRSLAPSAEVKSSQEPTAVDDTQQTPSPSPQSQPEVKESAVATGDGNVPGSPSEKASLNINDGAPSSDKQLQQSQPATAAPQRRSRFSATPNLARPKVHSAGKTASLPSQPSKTSSPLKTQSYFPKSPVPVAISRDDPQNLTLSDATTAAKHPPSSPCLPSTSGCLETSSSTPSLQEPCQTPKRIPNEDFEPQEGATPASCMLSPYVKLSRVDGPGSPLRHKMFSDKQQVLRALKLKELMKLERRKEITQRKSERQKREHSFEMDRNKMTLADFIYYLPETNPMKSSLSTEETKTQSTAPPSPVVHKNLAEAEEEEDDEADDEMMVPKVKVAEDGSLILDEESLTVRVQRTSNTVVDNANLLFERGSTTTYSSFRKNCYVKKWSIRETDMFYLAISMVGTDFSLIAQLLTHRSRAEIRRKFRKEEKENSWRVDKAFRNKRPYDAEFFSFLLKRILAKDKEKSKSIKLVVKSNKTKKGKGGKKAKPIVNKDSINNEDEELCSVDSASFDLEKENEDNSNVKEADLPSSTSKKRKRTIDTKSCEKSREPRKKNKTQKKGKCSVEGEDDLDCEEVDNEDQSCLPVSEKKRKRLKKGDQEEQAEKKDAKKKRQKKKKKTLEVQIEETTDGENEAVNEEHTEASTVPTKKRKRSKTCADEDLKTTKRNSKTKKSKTLQEECSGSELGADGSEVSAVALSVEEDQREKLIPESAAQKEISQSSSKLSKRPVPNLAKLKAKKNSEPKGTVETEDTVAEAQDESCGEAENEFRIRRLAEKQLQSQPVVVLERTPPRLKDSESSSENQDHLPSSQSPQSSPGMQMRAEKVKRNLTASDDGSEASLSAEENQREKLIPEHAAQEEISQSSFQSSLGLQMSEEKVEYSLTPLEEETVGQCWIGSDASPEEMSSTAMPDHVISQKSKQMEADQRMEERTILPHLEFLTSSEVNGKILLKRPVVLVSREEVERYLRIQTQTAAVESENQLDLTSARAHHAGDNCDGHEEQGPFSVTLKKRVSQDPEIKEGDTTPVSDQQNVAENGRLFSKATPNLSRAVQSSHRPLNEQTIEFSQDTLCFKHDSAQLQCLSDVEDGLNKSLVQDDVRTTEDDLPSLTLVDIPEATIQLEKSPSHTCENDDQEEEDSEPSESEIRDTMIDEPQVEMERIFPVSQQTSEPEGDPAETPEHQSAVKDLPSNKVDLQECEPNEDHLSSLPLFGSTQMFTTQAHVDSTGKGNDEQTNPVLSDDESLLFEHHSPDSSFCDHPTEHTSSMCDADTMMFSASAAEEIQIPDEQDSKQQDSTEDQSADSEVKECSVNLDGNESEILGVELNSTDKQIVSDKQSVEEPTFILTLYEIPASQLFQEVVSGQQDVPPYELQPAQVHTPLPFSGSPSCTLESSCGSLHMESEETDKPGSSISHKDDSLVPLSMDAADAKDAGTPLISSQESGCDDVIGAPEMLSCNSATTTDVLKMDENPTQALQTKASSQRRSKIKVKPNLKPCVKTGPSGKGQFDSTHSPSLPSSHAKEQTEIKSNLKTSAPEKVDSKCPEDNESRAHDGHDIVREEESHVKGRSPLRTEDQMGEDSVDSLVHSTVVNESKDKIKDGHEDVSHRVLADAFVLSSRETKDVFNKVVESLHDGELLKTEVLSVRPDSEKPFSAVTKEKMTVISEESVTCSEVSGVMSSADQETFVPFWRGELQVKPKIPKRTSNDDLSRKKQSDIGSNDPSTTQTTSSTSLIKKELEEKLEERTEQEDFSNEDFDTRLAKSSECSDSPPVELKIEGATEDLSQVMLTDTVVPDDVHMERRSSVPQMDEASQCTIAAEEEQEVHSHEGVSHMLLTDILIPVCEDMKDDLSQEWMATGEGTLREAEKPQVREDPDLLCSESQSSNAGPSTSPKRKRQTQENGSGKLLVKMMFPKKKAGDSPKRNTSNPPKTTCISEPKCPSTQSSLESITISDLLPLGSEDHEEGGVSHMVLSDILLPVLDEVAERSLQDDAVKVEKSTDIRRPENTEGDERTASRSVPVEWKTPSFTSLLHPKPEFSKRKDDPAENDLHLPGSLATPQQSLDPQAEEWSLKSNMLPMDSDEIENWCEGVSHMLLSDAFVPVSEEISEKNTETKAFASSCLLMVEKCALSRPIDEETPSEISDEVTKQLHTTKSNEREPASQVKKSPVRSTFQMTLRSPERRLTDQPCVLKSPKAAPKTPQRAQTSVVKESIGSPARQHVGEISSVCRVQLERLSVEEICASQRVLQPKHHSTPVTVKTRGNEMHKALHGSRISGLESQAEQKPLVPPALSPKVVLQRIQVTATDVNTSPARVSQPSAGHQSFQDSPPVSKVNTDTDPKQVSQFFLDDIFTEVVDPD